MTIEQLEALEKAATAGPWYVKWDFNVFGVGERLTASCGGHTSNRLDGGTTENTANTRFVAEARNFMPALLAVAKAAKAVARWTEQEPYGTIKMRDDTFANNALAELCEAISRLEAQ